ncbi:MAG: hypothetical protein ACM34K_18290 [Bacillota bacterium]
MKKNKFIKISGGACIWIIVIAILILIIQLTVAENISLSNNIIDNYLHFGKYLNIGLIVLLAIVMVFINAEKLMIKVISGTFFFALLIPFFFLGLLTYGIVFRGENADQRLYFYNKDGYSYYIKSERFMAFEGPMHRLYKERPLFSFIKERLVTTDSEMKALGVDPDAIKAKFNEVYFINRK